MLDIIDYKKMISHSESPKEGGVLDAWPVVVALKQLQPSKNYSQVSVFVEVASVKVHEAYDIFNADVAFAVVVQLAVAEAFILQILGIGTAVHLLLPVFMRLCK